MSTCPGLQLSENLRYNKKTRRCIALKLITISQQFGIYVHSLGFMYTVWDLCTQSGIIVHSFGSMCTSLGSMYTIWDLCAQFGIMCTVWDHVHSLGSMCTVWDLCAQFRIYVLSLGYICTVWDLCAHFGTFSPSMFGMCVDKRIITFPGIKKSLHE